MLSFFFKLVINILFTKKALIRNEYLRWIFDSQTWAIFKGCEMRTVGPRDRAGSRLRAGRVGGWRGGGGPRGVYWRPPPPASVPHFKFKVGAARAAAQCEGVRPAHRSSALIVFAMSVRRSPFRHENSSFTHRDRLPASRWLRTTRIKQTLDYHCVYGLQCLC